MIAGMLGCGKLLTAKDVATLFGQPLLRLGVSDANGNDSSTIWTCLFNRFQEIFMHEKKAYEMIGQFVVTFQHVESYLKDMLALIADADEECIRILTSEMEYTRLVKTLDVMYSWIIDKREISDLEDRKNFHELMSQLLKLGELRNEIVHSKHYPILCLGVDDQDSSGFYLENSRLRASKGGREAGKKSIFQTDLDCEYKKLAAILDSLEVYKSNILKLKDK